jgi:hypothetical protein
MAQQKVTGKLNYKKNVSPPWTTPPWGDDERVRLSVETKGGTIDVYVHPTSRLAKLPDGATVKLVAQYKPGKPAKA